MKKINILHLYSQTMDLYGDHKNLTVLCQRIQQSGCEVEVTTAQQFESLELQHFDMVYVGHGKARNLAAVAPHFVSHKEQICTAIEGGQVWLVTGNARELFGKQFSTVDGTSIPGIGLFDYEGVETNQVYVSDMIGHPSYDEKATVYGFANRTAYLEGENKYPLFEVITGFGDGREPDGKEGTHYKNFFGTWSMGPVLARNPSFMKVILKLLLKEDYRELDYELEQKALELVLKEFQDKQ